MTGDVERLVAGARTLGLDELGYGEELLRRVDRKYVVHEDTLALALAELLTDHRVLEVDGRRWSAYASTYFDSEDLAAFRAHVQGRRRRFKVRTRRYVDSDTQLLEVKLKGRRGETVKHRLEYAGADPATLTDAGRAFVETTLATSYPGLGVAPLGPVLESCYERLTLVAEGARVTVDRDLVFRSAGRVVCGLDPAHVIVESKSRDGRGPADRVLRGLGVRPVTCSKYCVGVALTRPDVRPGDVVAPIRRWLPRTAHA